MSNLKVNIRVLFGFLLMTLGGILLSANIYGLFNNIRPAVFFEDELRFANDSPIPHEQTLVEIIKHKNESNIDYTHRLTKVIDDSIAHIHWEKYDAKKFNQLVPIWENYFLYFAGILSNIPEFKKYHFADYERSLKRGIGICGDASMIMSQLLDNNNISNQIITFPGHVIVAVKFDKQNKELLFDPDFGVSLPFSPEEIKQSPHLVNNYYLQAGYFDYDIRAFNKIYNNDYQRWNGVSHFITHKYYFEKISYYLKWPLPIIAIIIGSCFFIFNRKKL